MGSKLLNLFLIVVIIVCVITGVICGDKVYKRVKTDNELVTTYQKIQSDVKRGENINWTKLKKINSDVVAWIKVKDTKIDYPIVQGKNNQIYLHRNIYMDKAQGGCIFLDSKNSRSLDLNENIIFYGHHMRNGTMFADLMKFRKKSFASKHTIDIYTPNKSYQLKPFSVYAKAAEAVIPVKFASEKSRSDYLGTLENRNSVKGLRNVKERLPIFTFATCSYEGDDYRTYVHCQ